MNLRDAYRAFNEALAVRITRAVGTMTCAWIFAALALVSLPGALATGNLVVIVGWTAQTFLQLVLLSILAVGQQAQGDELESHRVAQTAHHARVERQLAATAGRTEALHARLDKQADRLDAIHTHLTTEKPRTGRQRKESAP